MSDNIPAQREFDHERAEAAIRELLIAVGEDPDREGLRETPARVARAYDRYIAFSRFISSHNPKIILLPRGGIKLCRICTGKNASGYCFISLMW